MPLTVHEEHQRKVAQTLLALSDKVVSMGGMTREQAREILEKLAQKEAEEESEKI